MKYQIPDWSQYVREKNANRSTGSEEREKTWIWIGNSKLKKNDLEQKQCNTH